MRNIRKISNGYGSSPHHPARRHSFVAVGSRHPIVFGEQRSVATQRRTSHTQTMAATRPRFRDARSVAMFVLPPPHDRHPQIKSQVVLTVYTVSKRPIFMAATVRITQRVTVPNTELVFRASNDLSIFGRLSYKTLQNVQQKQSLDGNPIFAILHEPIYCQGCVPPFLYTLSC